MSQESKTPRTDAEWTSVGMTERNLYRLACDLETELAAVTEERDALIASARIREANSGWRPIETAPRDGRVLLMAEDGHVTGLKARHVFSAYWSPDERYFNGGCWTSPVSEQLVFLPTHWMPLPAAPTTEPDQ